MKIILLLVVILVSYFSYYGEIDENGEKVIILEKVEQEKSSRDARY